MNVGSRIAPSPVCIDGMTFPSQTAAGNYFGVHRGIVQQSLNHGWHARFAAQVSNVRRGNARSLAKEGLGRWDIIVAMRASRWGALDPAETWAIVSEAQAPSRRAASALSMTTRRVRHEVLG